MTLEQRLGLVLDRTGNAMLNQLDAELQRAGVNLLDRIEALDLQRYLLSAWKRDELPDLVAWIEDTVPMALAKDMDRVWLQ